MATHVTRPDDVLERVQELTQALDELPDTEARDVAEALVGAMIDLYGEGLARILEAIDAAGPLGAAIREQLVDDGVVASLLLIHDLYPVDLETRVHEALATVRPYLESHGGDVELLGVEDGVARLRLQGHCKTCPASSATLELAIQQALDEAAPDLLGLEVEGIAPAATGPRPVSLGRALPLVGSAPPAPPATPAWLPLEEAGDVEPGTLQAVSVQGAPLIVANVAGSLLAYRSECPGCLSALGAARLDGEVLACPGCGREYDLPRAGRAVDGAGAPLEAVPLLRRAGRGVEVAMAR